MANSNKVEQKMAELQGKNSIIFRNLMKGIKKDFLTSKLDKLNPLIEALFMILRGHNSEGKKRGEKGRLLDPTEARLNSHEAVCALRYEGIDDRLKRLEQILLGSAGFIIAILISLLLKLH
jgi:hypothetical protein